MNAELQERLRTLRLVVFDFDGVFTDNRVWVFEDGHEAVCCNRSDGLGLARLRALGVKTAIISTETNAVVGQRAKKLNVHCVQACPDKREAVMALAKEWDIPLADTAFVGNDVNDLPACEVVGFPIAVADAHPDMARRALWQTAIAGGVGAVREVCDMIARSREEIPK